MVMQMIAVLMSMRMRVITKHSSCVVLVHVITTPSPMELSRVRLDQLIHYISFCGIKFSKIILIFFIMIYIVCHGGHYRMMRWTIDVDFNCI